MSVVKVKPIEQARRPLLKTKIAKRFDQAATQYNKQAVVQHQIAQASVAEFEKAKHNGARKYPKTIKTLLDLGCGTALASAKLQPFCEQYIGLDLSQSMLFEAHQNKCLYDDEKISADTHFINADAENLPLQDESVDAFYSSMAMQWCGSPRQVLSEVHRALTSQGFAMLAIMVDGSFQNLHNAWHELGMESRVNEFDSSSYWQQCAKQFKWKVNSEQRTFTTYHKNLISMLGSIKSVGANIKQVNADAQSAQSSTLLVKTNAYMRRFEIKAVEASIRHSNKSEAMLPLHYEVLFLTLYK